MEPGTLDVSLTKAEFPALDQRVAGVPLVYLDNAATTQKPKCVIDAVDKFYTRDNANVHRGVHELSQRASIAYDGARKTVASWINARRDSEVIFTKGCTEALNLVAASWGGANLASGDTVLVSTMEHHSNIVPWQVACEKAGAQVEPIPLTGTSEIDLDWLVARLAKGRVKAVAVKAVCNVTGTINPIKEITAMAHEKGAIAVVDAAQALAHQRVDAGDWDSDFIALSAHKAYGPMGVGALYGKSALLDAMPPYQTGGGMVRGVSFEKTGFAEVPEKFEAGTPNAAGAVGFAKAIEFLDRLGVERAASHEQILATLTEQKLGELNGLTIHGSAVHKAGIVSFTMTQSHPHDIGTILDQSGVAVRTGHHCCMPLMKWFGVPAMTRASFACYNDEHDVDSLVAAVVKVQEMFS